MYRILCGTPTDKCRGAATATNKGLRDSMKMHSSRVEAFKCYRDYLVSQGYTQVCAREFQLTADAPILVLPKKSHFGGVLRTGKSDKTARGSRFIPKHGGGIVF